MFGFYLHGYYVSRPYVEGIIPIYDDAHALNSEVKPCCDVCWCCLCCNCCCGTSVSMPIIPMYKLLQLTYFSYGGFTACNGCICGQSQYEELLVKAYYQAYQENELTTKEFYQREYNCDSFIELLKSRCNIDVNDINIDIGGVSSSHSVYPTGANESSSAIYSYNANSPAAAVAVPITVAHMEDRYEKLNY